MFKKNNCCKSKFLYYFMQVFNFFSLIIYVYQLLIYIRLNNSFKEFGKSLDAKFAKNGTIIIPYEKRENIVDFNMELTFILIQIIFTCLCFCSISTLYKKINNNVNSDDELMTNEREEHLI